MNMTAIAPAVVHPVTPLPGLSGHLAYSLDDLDDRGVLFAMRSLADPAVRLFVVRAEVFFADYTPEIEDETRESLDLGAGDDPLVLVVVNPSAKEGQPATANLMAPVVVNLTTGAALQVVCNGWPLRAELG